MIKYMGSKHVELTKQLAKDVSEMPKFIGERPLLKQHVDFLESKLVSGTFHSPQWAIAKRADGTTYRVNGQHSSTMLANANGHFPNGLNVTLLEYLIDDEVDLANLFSEFDHPKQVRSRRDTYNAHAKTQAEVANICTKSLGQILGGIAYAKEVTGSGITKRNNDAEYRAKMVHDPEIREFMNWANIVIDQNNSKMLKVPVIAAAYLTYQSNKTQADQFWRYVRDDSHPNNQNPTRTLSEFLKPLSTRAMAGKKWDQRAVFVKCIHAWNAYMTGKTTLLSYHPDAQIPPIR